MFEHVDFRTAVRERAVQLALSVIHTDDEGRQVHLPPAGIIPMAKEIEAYIAGDAE